MIGPRRLLAARIGITATFALAGLVSAVGSVRIPALTDRLHLNPAEVGVALLSVGVGAAIATQTGRWLIGRFGSRRVLVIACPAMAGLSAGSGVAPTFTLLVAAFALYGAAFGLLDSSMNAQAATL